MNISMKRKHLPLLVAVILCMAAILPASAQKQRARVYGIAFYNLENLFDTINNNGKYDLEFSPKGKYAWDGKKYWKKINNMAYAISRLTTDKTPDGPAVIGVSEIENISVLQDLVKAEPIAARGYKIVHHDSPDLRGVDVGLLYNPKQFRVLTVTNHRLNIPSKPNFKTRDQMCVVGLMGADRVAIIVNHWPSRRGGSEQSSYLREAAAALSMQIADSLLKIDPKMGIIVMGDLNDSPYDKSVTQVLKARAKAGEVKPGEFFNPFHKLLDDGIGSYIYRGRWDLFDQIIISYNLLDGGANGLTYIGAKVFNDAFLRAQEGKYAGYPFRTFSEGAFIGGYSDHFPTEIFLKQIVK